MIAQALDNSDAVLEWAKKANFSEIATRHAIRAAQHLGISRRTLFNQLLQYNIK